jgi:hypothetical protein
MDPLSSFSAPLAGSLSRRGFLKRTAAGTLFLIAARHARPAAAARAKGVPAPRTLDEDHAATLEAFCDRMITAPNGAPTAGEARLCLRIDHELALLSPAFAGDLRDALTLLEYSGFLEGKFRPFSRLGPEDQDDVIRGMMRSRLSWRRSAFLGLKQLAVFFYYADDRAWPRTGYDGPWVLRRVAATEREFPFPTPRRSFAPPVTAGGAAPLAQITSRRDPGEES